MQRLIFSFLLLCLQLGITLPADAADIELPLFLRTQILQNALAESLSPQPNKPTVLFQEGSYNFLHISNPQLSIRDGSPYFSCNAAAGMGFDSLGILPSTVVWKGSVLMRLDFFVDPQWQLRYRILDSTIYNEKGGKPVVTGFAWDLTKRFLHPRLEKYAFDLSMPQKEIIALLRLSASATDTAPLEAALNTIKAGPLRISAEGVTVPLIMRVPDNQTQPPPLAREAPLGYEELEKLQKIFEPLDAFLVFIIKKISTDIGDTLHEEQLFDLLITSRYELLAILTGQSTVERGDPLRLLFIDIWGQLRPIIESSGGQKGLMQKQLLRYMTFINAGDALLTLDAAAPGLGIHLTTDGLRRLARMLQPDSSTDPLKFDWQLDPALRDMFHFQPVPAPEPEPAPKTLPAPAPMQEAPAPEVQPAPSQKPLPEFPPEPPELTPQSPAQPEPAPATPAQPEIEPLDPTQPQPSPPEPTPPQLTTVQQLLNFFVAEAQARTLTSPVTLEMRQRLNFWVPSPEELPEYSRIIEGLLTEAAQKQIKQAKLDNRYSNIYKNLVPATAMIESCWQQFERKENMIAPLRSPAGGIGIMQINQNVWRGFYDLVRLQKDTAYNIQAGSEILMRYFQQHGLTIAKDKNNPEYAARATYAAYNAGPRAANRFLKADANARQKRVDDHLWELFQKIANGGTADVATCTIL